MIAMLITFNSCDNNIDFIEINITSFEEIQEGVNQKLFEYISILPNPQYYTEIILENGKQAKITFDDNMIVEDIQEECLLYNILIDKDR